MNNLIDNLEIAGGEDLNRIAGEMLRRDMSDHQFRNILISLRNGGIVAMNAELMRRVLMALTGPSYYIRELQAIRGLPDSPIDKLVEQYNSQVIR